MITTLAPGLRSVPSSLPRAIRSSRPSIRPSSTARMNPVAASSEARSGARTRSTSDAISVVTRRSSEASVGRSEARIRSLPTDDSATFSSIVVTSSASRISERSSAGERAATASTVAERSIRIRLVSSARAAARRIAGRPAPSSTASVMAASAARSGAAAPVCSWARSGNRRSPRPGQNTLGHSTTTTAPSNTPTPTSAART